MNEVASELRQTMEWRLGVQGLHVEPRDRPLSLPPDEKDLGVLVIDGEEDRGRDVECEG